MPASVRRKAAIVLIVPGLLRLEDFYSANHSIALPTCVGRVHLVIVGGLGAQSLHAHAENRIGMSLIEPDVRFCRLSQVFGTSAVVHHAEVFVSASRVSARPRN